MWREVVRQVLPNLIALTNQFVDAAKEGDTMKKVADELSGALRGIANTAKLYGGLLGKLEQVRDFLVTIERAGAKINPNSWFDGENFVARYLKATFPALYKPIGGQSPSPSPRPAAPGRGMDPRPGAPRARAERSAAGAAGAQRP